MDDRRTNRRLGYPDDARLLIITADDFGMCHSVNEGILQAANQGVVSATTLMTLCPWAPHAMQLLHDNPEIPFGVHLTVICDFAPYRWGPLSSKNRVPSLIDEDGYFYRVDRIPEFLAQANLDELEVEFRAQIGAVLAAGLEPTHLDWHCLIDGGSEDIFDMTLGLAKEHGLTLRVHERRSAHACHQAGLLTTDHGVMDSYRLPTDDKAARYAQMLRSLPADLSEWAVHPSLGNEEAQALEPDTWQVRRTDLDFLVSQEAREILEEENIMLLDYRALQRASSHA